MFRLAAVFAFCTIPALSAAPAAPPVPRDAQATLQFDPQIATNAWLATVPAAAKAKSDAYFEGGYWLMLWDFLYSAGIMVLLLETGLSARMRDFSERIAAKYWMRAYLYAIQFLLITAILSFPLALYEGFLRERQYGLMNQSFGGWFRDQVVGLCVMLVLAPPVIAVLFVLVRRLSRTWHLWGSAVAVLFTMFVALIAPIYIAPLFNTYKPLQNETIKSQILSLASENGIPAKDVYEVDASRQSKRVSANVSGLFGTERITLNDNLLNRCSPQAILSVMGHEMGHYAMHHVRNFILFACITITVLFGLLRWLLQRSLAYGSMRWHVRAMDDVAILPLAVLILTILSFLFTPISNTFTRTQEYEADIFGLNAARQPDGEAEADLLLGEYRKLDPGPLEEFVFFDHPSGRTRIYAAMRWKAENLCLFDLSLPCRVPAPNATVAPTGPSQPSEIWHR